MKDIFGDTNKRIKRYNEAKLSKLIPSLTEGRKSEGEHDETTSHFQQDDEDEYEDEIDLQRKHHLLWNVRYKMIGEEDYLVSSKNNMFSRRSNYLRLGMFYKQACIKYEFDKSKEIVYYMYSYDEYSVRKTKQEM